jgi:hypothetical protein
LDRNGEYHNSCHFRCEQTSLSRAITIAESIVDMLPHHTTAQASITLEPHHDGRIVVRPFSDPAHAIDVTESVIRCIATAIEDAVGGNPVLNRLEAERAVHALMQPQPPQHRFVEAGR